MRCGVGEQVSDLVESAGPGEDDVGVLHLDGSLAQPHHVGTDTNGPTRHLKGR